MPGQNDDDLERFMRTQTPEDMQEMSDKLKRAAERSGEGESGADHLPGGTEPREYGDDELAGDADAMRDQLDRVLKRRDRDDFIQRRGGASGVPPQEAHEAVRTLLEWIGEDPDRPGLEDTPGRVAGYLRRFTLGEPFNLTTFDAEGTDEMIVQSGIRFYSMCEHHLLPFTGYAAVGYVPSGEIVGLSKLARCVRHFAAGLQNHERLTGQVAGLLADRLDPEGVAVVIEAEHLCMSMRGVKAPGATTRTSRLTGCFRDDARTRSEFLDLARTA